MHLCKCMHIRMICSTFFIYILSTAIKDSVANIDTFNKNKACKIINNQIFAVVHHTITKHYLHIKMKNSHYYSQLFIPHQFHKYRYFKIDPLGSIFHRANKASQIWIWIRQTKKDRTSDSEKESGALAKKNVKRKENNNARQDRGKHDREREISVAEEECWLDAMMCYKNMIRSRNSPPALATVVMEMEVLGCWHGSQCILFMLFFLPQSIWDWCWCSVKDS